MRHRRDFRAITNRVGLADRRGEPRNYDAAVADLTNAIDMAGEDEEVFERAYRRRAEAWRAMGNTGQAGKDEAMVDEQRALIDEYDD